MLVINVIFYLKGSVKQSCLRQGHVEGDILPLSPLCVHSDECGPSALEASSAGVALFALCLPSGPVSSLSHCSCALDGCRLWRPLGASSLPACLVPER